MLEANEEQMRMYDPLQFQHGDIVKVPIAGRGELYFRIVRLERDFMSNTFLRCFNIPKEESAIEMNPWYACLWQDCSELFCLYLDYPTRGTVTTDVPMFPGTFRVGETEKVFYFGDSRKTPVSYTEFKAWLRGAVDLPGLGEMIERDGVVYLDEEERKRVFASDN
jgi:hypothetical protein